LAIDPSYAPAAALVGSCRMHQRAHRLAPVSEEEIAETVRLAEIAIVAGKDDPDVLWMAGWTLSVFGGDPATGANVVARALAINPNSAHAWLASGFASLRQNHWDEAIAAFERAIRLIPRDPWGARAFPFGLAAAHQAAGRYEEAIKWADQSLAAQPDYVPALLVKVFSSAQLGRITEARNWLSRLLDFEPGLTIERLKASVPITPESMPRYVEGLRLAGLPET
jgi:adenylate cyclase